MGVNGETIWIISKRTHSEFEGKKRDINYQEGGRASKFRYIDKSELLYTMLANVGNLIIFLESIRGTRSKVKLGVIYKPGGDHSILLPCTVKWIW